ncbi:TDT family transporter [Streptacidiphilus sp. PB12-B1b]|uniref:TDT family transporter n=1 Tax=Streptacidiphilus sp. PB12-B1b TaxID=2705012 RepID=UPI0015FD32FD|nr:TDT family transporter [Streptacidiphilus sp. PB12-B1b]QMU77911.1 TDT family transporter [Streptacidiphilus sp. PB12-B1b]
MPHTLRTAPRPALLPEPKPATVPASAPAPAAAAPAAPAQAGRGLLRDLQQPGQVFAALTPNWYASVMGTGIVAVAAASLPVQFPGLRAAATAVWGLAAFLLVALTAATAVHWIRHRATARGHASDPVMAHFYGAPPMAMLTVGAGALLLGRDVIGLRAAVDVDWVLWFAGTATGLLCAVAVPYLAFTRHDLRPDSAFGGWLMPVVPPMVSASTGALLIPHAPAGQARLSLLLCCYAMFGLSLLASVVVITLVWQRLALHGTGPARMVPTLWIVLGPLGQSVTAANLLGGVAHLALPAPYSTALQAFGVVYGVPVWGFALLWACLAAAITLRTARAGLPFSLTWWSFTFPVGTVVTGTSGLALHTGAEMFRIAAAVLYAGLVLAWLLVAARTAHGSLRGRLFLPADQQQALDGAAAARR